MCTLNISHDVVESENYKISHTHNECPVAQPLHRVLFNLRGCISELLHSDKIDKVKVPTQWIFPAHLAPKKDSQRQTVVNMRTANDSVV
jgi:hypothetical protein